MKTAVLAVAVAALIVPSVWAKDKPAQAAPVSKTFKVGADCKIVGSEDKALTLADLKAGDKIGIVYKDDAGTLVASRVHVMGEPKGDKAAKGGKKGEKKADDLMFARGVITAVDATAGTVTIDAAEGHGHKK